MTLSDLGRKYPLTTIFAALFAVEMSMSLVGGQGLAEQLASTSIGALVVVGLLYSVAPKSLSDFPVMGAACFKTARDFDNLELAGNVVRVGVVGAGAVCLLVLISPDYAALFANLDFAGEFTRSAAFDAEPDPLPMVPRVFLFMLLCLLTGILEEGLLRGLVVPLAFQKAYREQEALQSQNQGEAHPSPDMRVPATAAAHKLAQRSPVASSSADGKNLAEAKDLSAASPITTAALFSSVLFALLHVVSTQVPPAFTAGGNSLDIPLLVVFATQAALKAIQSGLFGFCMAALFVRTRTIWLPLAAHVMFDLFYLAPMALVTGQLPATYLTGSYGDIAILAVTSVMLLPLAAKSAKWLRCEVVTYSSFHE